MGANTTCATAPSRYRPEFAVCRRRVAVTYVPGRVGNAFSFVANGGIHASALGLPSGNADRTLEAWVRIDQNPNDGESVFAGYGTFESISQLFFLGAGNTAVPFITQWGGGLGGSKLALGTWSHVAATTTGSHFVFYVDGVEIDEADVELNTGVGDFFDRQLRGAVDEVSIYSRALAPTEIAAIHSIGGGGKCH